MIDFVTQSYIYMILFFFVYILKKGIGYDTHQCEEQEEVETLLLLRVFF